jgi:hypothetical protein
MMSNRDNVPLMDLTVKVLAKKDHVVLVIPIGELPLRVDGRRPDTVGLRFMSVEHMLTIFHHIAEKAAEVWPDDPYIQIYLEDE